MSDRQSLYVFAGSDGSGKTTLARRLLMHRDIPFVNIDDICTVDNISRYQAARIALSQRQRLLKEGKSYAFEATFAGKSEFKTLHAAKCAGFRVEVHYVGVQSYVLNQKRIQERVLRGGVATAGHDIERRWYRSLNNMYKTIESADSASVYDNSGEDGFVLVLKVVSQRHKSKIVYLKPQPPAWFRLVYQAHKVQQNRNKKSSTGLR